MPSVLPARSRALLASVVTLGLLLAAPTARGADAPAPIGPPPAELERGTGQYILGVLVATLSAGAALASPNDGTILVIGLASPAFVGGTVCWYGRKSPYYDGPCAAAIVASYLGLLATYPGAVIGANLDRSSVADTKNYEGGVFGAFIGAAVGYVLVAPLLATASWHLFKKRRAGDIQVAMPLPIRSNRLPFTRAAGEVQIPLLSLRF